MITVRGAEVLKAADCVIYDKLANPALLTFARPDAEIIPVPKRIGKGSFTQDEINKVLVEKAIAGKTVVRLKGGDPCVFGRCTEELEILNEAGIGFEIVPGVTAGVAMAAYAGIMLTDREYSSQLAFVTGHEATGKDQTGIDWDVLAGFGGTIVFYMGIGNLETIAQRLIENGKRADTPAAVIANATFPTQRIVRAPLSRIREECERQQIEPPALVVIGDVANNDPAFNWFMKQPLFGKSIIVTRDVPGNADFAGKIIRRGGNPVKFATIKIRPLTDSNEFLRTLAKFTEYDWIIFSSQNGVAVFFDAIESLGKDARVFSSAKVAAIGSKTAEKLGEFGIKADFVPDVFTGRQLGGQLIGYTSLHGKKVLLLRSQIASKELAEILSEAGAEVDDIDVYTAEEVKGESEWLAEDISGNSIDWVTFASPSSVDGFFKQVSVEAVNSSKTKVASIGPVTSARLAELGVTVDLTAAEHTIDGLLNAIEQEESGNGFS